MTFYDTGIPFTEFIKMKYPVDQGITTFEDARLGKFVETVTPEYNVKIEHTLPTGSVETYQLDKCYKQFVAKSKFKKQDIKSIIGGLTTNLLIHLNSEPLDAHTRLMSCKYLCGISKAPSQDVLHHNMITYLHDLFGQDQLDAKFKQYAPYYLVFTYTKNYDLIPLIVGQDGHNVISVTLDFKKERVYDTSSRIN